MIEVIIFIFGLIIGSFINVLIYRLPYKEDIIKKRSHCPKCNKILSWFELIPVVSFLMQKGRCRYCKALISFQYIIIEIFTGVLFLMVFQKLNAFLISDNLIMLPTNYLATNIFYFLIYLLYFFYIISVFIAVAVIDFKTFLIPDILIFPATIITLIFQSLNFFFDIYNNLKSLIFYNIISAFVIFLFFFFLYFFSKGEAMGFGDAKLGFLIGIFLPFPLNISAIMLSFILGGFFGIILLSLKKANRKTQIPFGPFMSIGAIITFLFPEIANLIF